MESGSLGVLEEIIDVGIERLRESAENAEIYMSDEENDENEDAERYLKPMKIRATLSLSYMIQGKREELGERQTQWMRSNDKLREKLAAIGTKYGKEIEKEIFNAIDEVQHEDFPEEDLNAMKI